MENYKTTRDYRECLQWYTKESFFFRTVNRGLRKLVENISEVGYLRLPFSDVFNSIKEVYQRQEGTPDRQSDILCYRGCRLSADEITLFQENIGGYIQMEGFLSTSVDRGIVEAYINNGFVII